MRVPAAPRHGLTESCYKEFSSGFLGDALERDRHFDQLWIDVEPQPYLARVARQSTKPCTAATYRCSPPRPARATYRAGSGEPLKEIFEQPGMALVRRRLELIGRARPRAATLVYTRFADDAFGRAKQSRYRQTEPARAMPTPTATVWSLPLRSVGDRLEALALRAGDEATWIGLTPSREGSWSLAPLGLDTYSGLPGVALVSRSPRCLNG